MIGLGDIKIGKLKIGSSDVQKVFLGEVQIYPDSSAGGNYKATISLNDGRVVNIDCDESENLQYGDVFGWVEDPNDYGKITKLEINGDCTKTVKLIPYSSRYEFTKLTDVVIGEGVNEIEDDAFSLTVSGGYNNIYYNIRNLSLPESLERIGSNAFNGLSYLDNLSIPDNVSYIGESAFESCLFLKTITNYPDNMTYFPKKVFKYAGLVNLVIPKTVIAIKEEAFSRNTSLNSIQFHNNVSELAKNSFNGCTSLISVSLPNNLETIGEGSFSGCTKMTSVRFPDKVRWIEQNAFKGCGYLSELDFSNCENLYRIDNNAFDGCTYLKSVVIPKTVGYLEQEVFQTCAFLETFEFEEGSQMDYIPNNFLTACISLKKITLPDTITRIGASAFSGCKALEELNLKSTTPPTLENYVFQNTNDTFKIYVPCDAVDAYKAAWPDYADRIECKPPMLRGKFTDDSTSDDWWYYKNGSTISSNKVNIAEYVDPDTKEFAVVPEISNSANSIFFGNTKLEKIYEVPITENITTMVSTFRGCSGLTSLNASGWNTENVSDMTYMFGNCYGLRSLDLSEWNTENLSTMNNMFQSCSGLTSLNLSGWKPNNVNDVKYMFQNCYNLTSLDLSGFDISALTSTYSMFNGCSGLTSINLSGWNFENLTDYSLMFSKCNNLTTVIGPVYNLKVALSISNCPLTNESAMVFINGLSSEVSGNTLSFKKSTYDTLTPEQIKIATDKGWTIRGI